MAKFTITPEQYRRPYSWALGQLLGQKPRGSGDPDNEFSIVTVRNEDGTYTITTPALSGRATRAEVQAVLDDPRPEQPAVVRTRRDDFEDKLDADTITFDEVKELLRLRK